VEIAEKSLVKTLSHRMDGVRNFLTRSERGHIIPCVALLLGKDGVGKSSIAWSSVHGKADAAGVPVVQLILD